MINATMDAPVPERGVSRLMCWLGARHRDRRGVYRMAWGELSFGGPGWALELDLFGDPVHFALHVQVWWLVSAFIRLPFLQRWAHEPDDMMESWGLAYHCEPSHLTARWGATYTMFTPPWQDWGQVAHDVLRPNRSWAAFVGSWERDKTPDGRAIETHAYNYLLRSGETQARTATIHVERRIRRLKWLRWTSAFQRVSTYIDVEFSDEVGERSGSWKGGTTGCSYELRPGETPRECLKRMEQERKF